MLVKTELVEPGESVTFHDQRNKITASFRHLTAEELEEYEEAKREKENGDDQQPATGTGRKNRKS